MIVNHYILQNYSFLVYIIQHTYIFKNMRELMWLDYVKMNNFPHYFMLFIIMTLYYLYQNITMASEFHVPMNIIFTYIYIFTSYYTMYADETIIMSESEQDAVF